MATSSDTSDQNNVRSRRPAESAFKQQRLPAWQPILTAGTVLPTFFVIGIAFIPVGIGLLYFSDEVKEHVIDYTHCTMAGDTTANITCADYIKQNNMVGGSKCMCEIEFNLTEDFKSEVYFYYGLSNYYQNHRRYVKSRDDSQLLGRLNLQPSTDCMPFDFAYDENGVKKPVAPCGAIANSLFNDTLTLFSQDIQDTVPVLRTGIAWNSDKEIKFRNPPLGSGTLKDAFANFTKPANWAKHVWQLDEENPDNNGFQNEDLIVWMRTAALPTFRKLYRRVDHTQTGFRTGLNKGPYTLKIEYNYPVTDFDGTKSFVISTTSLLGGKNPFLGVAYVVVGTLCLLLGIVLLVIHVRCSKRMDPLPSESMLLNEGPSQGPKKPPRSQGGPRIQEPQSSSRRGSNDRGSLNTDVIKPERNLRNRAKRFLLAKKHFFKTKQLHVDIPRTLVLSRPVATQTTTDLLNKKITGVTFQDFQPDSASVASQTSGLLISLKSDSEQSTESQYLQPLSTSRPSQSSLNTGELAAQSGLLPTRCPACIEPRTDEVLTPPVIPVMRSETLCPSDDSDRTLTPSKSDITKFLDRMELVNALPEQMKATAKEVQNLNDVEISEPNAVEPSVLIVDGSQNCKERPNLGAKSSDKDKDYGIDIEIDIIMYGRLRKALNARLLGNTSKAPENLNSISKPIPDKPLPAPAPPSPPRRDMATSARQDVSPPTNNK